MKTIPSSRLKPKAYRHPILWRLCCLLFVPLSPLFILLDAMSSDGDEDDRTWGDRKHDILFVLSVALLPWEKRGPTNEKTNVL